LDWRKDKWTFSWDNTVTYGITYRLDDPDKDIIGLTNGGRAYSVNGDDGNLNYGTGIASNALQLTSELEVKRDNFGIFLRGWGLYDYENEEEDRKRTDLSDQALDLVGTDVELRDAYAWLNFRIADKPAEVRAGDQVVSWGESTFIQGGINVINPIYVPALRTPGREIRNALLPVGLVWGSFSVSNNVTLETFYEYDWEEIELDPPGSLFSTNDFVGAGGDIVYLGFGDAFDTLPAPVVDPFDPTRSLLGVPREFDVTADDGGQYGVALRWFVPALGDTEFGFYYINYHSRLPTINGRTGTVLGGGRALASREALAALPPNPTPADIVAAIGAGTTAGASYILAFDPGADPGEAAASALEAATGGVTAAAAGGPALAQAYTIDLYAQTARYFLAYPEDVELFGISFNSQIGTTGLALQGELSYRRDAPLQVDDVELLFAALEPVNPAFVAGPGASQITTYTGIDYSTAFETPIRGFILEDTSQFQSTLTKIWPQVLGADQVLLLLEGAVTHIPDMPSKSKLRLEGPGTYTSGNPWHADPANALVGGSHPGKAAERSKRYADSTSWGYRLVGRLQYNNAIGAVKVSPRFAWGHDVSGVSPGPGGNFIEGRKAATVGVNFDFQSRWSADIAYTDFFGAGRYNLINDRDFVAANFKYSF
jgi:hypothetical protein